MKNQKQISCGIDWLRFQCLFGEFNLATGLNESEKNLLGILKLNPFAYDIEERNSLGSFGYSRSYLFGEDIRIGVAVRDTAKVKGANMQFIVEISGSACRNFESRGGSWQELFKFFENNLVRVKRIDLFMDSINGALTIDSIKRRIELGAFTCPFRAYKPTGKRGDQMYRAVAPNADDGGDLLFAPTILETKKGYSCTFGNHGSSQELQIYDKSSERQSKRIGVSTKNWIRFEARFSGKRADFITTSLLINGFEEKRFGQIVAGLISSLIEFKDIKNIDLKSLKKNMHLNRLDRWKPYDSFLGGVEKIKVPCCQSKIESTIIRSMDWAKKSWVTTMFKIFGSGFEVNSNLVSSMVENIKKKGFKMSDFATIKNYYLSNKKKPLTNQEIIDNVQLFIDTLSPDSKVDLMEMFSKDYCRKKNILYDSDTQIDINSLD